MDFYKEVLERKSIITDFSSNSDTLWVLFGGIFGGIGVDIIEFGNITKKIDVKKIFIRDLNNAFYQNGIDNKISSCEKLVRVIESLIYKSKAKKVVFIGNSSGGYAALSIGSMLNVDEVHAFSPITFFNDKFLPKESVPFLKNVIFLKENGVIDLNKVFKYQYLKGKYNIYYDKGSLDAYHAYNIIEGSNIIAHEYTEGGHELIKILKKKGELQKILENIY